MGWNDLTVKQDSPLTDGLDGQSVYFVHSYFTDVPEEYIDVTADYGIEVPAMIHKEMSTVPSFTLKNQVTLA